MTVQTEPRIERACKNLADSHAPQAEATIRFALGTLVRLLPFAVKVSSWKENRTAKKPSAGATREKTGCNVVVKGPSSCVGFRISAEKAYFQSANDPSRGYVKTLIHAFSEVTSEYLQLAAATVLDKTRLETLLSTFSNSLVARFLQTLTNYPVEIEALLSVLHQTRDQTYENHSICQGLLFTPGDSEDAGHDDGLLYGDAYADERKRLFPLSDGYRTALTLSTTGRLRSLIHLPSERPKTASGRKRSRTLYYPQWVQRLAWETERSATLGLALNALGDILVLYRGFLLLSFRNSEWSLYVHTAPVEAINRTLRSLGANQRQARLLANLLYSLSLDLSYRRSGALLGVVRSRASLKKLLHINDLLDRTQNRGLRSILRDLSVRNDPGRGVWHAISSMDGATVFDTTGTLVACGAIVKQTSSSLSGDPGARTTAAKALSHAGVAIKVSSDGDISGFVDGDLVFEIM